MMMPGTRMREQPGEDRRRPGSSSWRDRRRSPRQHPSRRSGNSRWRHRWSRGRGRAPPRSRRRSSAVLIRVCPSAISPPNGSVQICVCGRRNRVIVLQDPVRQIRAAEHPGQTLPPPRLLGISQGFAERRRRAGSVRRLHDVSQRRHELLRPPFERGQVVGERRTEAVIGRRRRDRRCVQQRKGGWR